MKKLCYRRVFTPEHRISGMLALFLFSQRSLENSMLDESFKEFKQQLTKKKRF